jgi:hypothetical protein
VAFGRIVFRISSNGTPYTAASRPFGVQNTRNKHMMPQHSHGCQSGTIKRSVFVASLVLKTAMSVSKHLFNVTCPLKGANKYGKVADGFLTVEGPLVKVLLQVEMKWGLSARFRRSASDGQGARRWCPLDRWGRGSTKIDTPLILTTVLNSVFEPEQILQRTFENDFLPVVEGPA